MKDRNTDSSQRATPVSPPPLDGGADGQGEASIEQVALYRKKRVVIPLLLALVGGVAVFWYWYVSLRGTVSTDDAYIDADRVSVSARILDRITEIQVKEGDNVTKGQPLVQLDDSGLRAQKLQAEAALALARQSVVLSSVRLRQAQDDFRRAEVQFKQSVIPKEQYDHATQALAAAQAERSIAMARVDAAQAQLGIVDNDLANTLIFSPVNGEVAKRWVMVGDVVQAGQPILSVYDTTNVWITANLEETKLANIREGDVVRVDVDAYPDMGLSGTVQQIEGYVASQFALIPPNNASGNFTKVAQRIPVKISFSKDGHPASDPRRLLPGMSVEVTIEVH